MKGLLYKDFLLLWKNGKTLLFLGLLYMVMGVYSSSSQNSNVFFGILACLMISNVAVTLISVDERDRWNVYSDALPVSRGMYVSSKYILTLTMDSGLVALSTLSLLCTKDPSLTLEMLNIVLAISFLLPALMLPVVFWLGAEKGRLAYIVICGLIAGGSTVVGIALRGGRYVGADFGGKLWTAGLISTALFFLSWPISMKLYEKREF